ncbi:hypothetical protein [Streptomyces parvus]|uniref:Uncharacterized protein n=1 Tax=Streptomyces parvus TaxID=66428 RepID=A0A7K3RRU6_9ACTN|nr:hypothetical protein [Streptomyces parvus]NEC17919.1 hypothetical protein [Streptomyces parvus]
MTDTPMTPDRDDPRAAVRALLAERRARLFAQARFTASGRRVAWATIRTREDTP